MPILEFWGGNSQGLMFSVCIYTMIVFGLSAISSFVASPQRDSFTEDRSFLIAQADQNVDIPFRVLWIHAVETVDGLVFQQNSSLLAQDTTQADGFLYDPNNLGAVVAN